MAKFFHPVPSLTNGMVPEYPKTIYVSEFKLSHWGTLSEAFKTGGTGSDDAISYALTGVLDDCIDFEKTGFIKSSDELTIPDRKKLFMFQRIQTDSPEFRVVYGCPKCKSEIPTTYDLLKYVEKIIEKPVKEGIINIPETDDKLHLGLYTKKSISNYENLLENFRETGKKSDYLSVSIEEETGEKKIVASDFTKRILDVFPLINIVGNTPGAMSNIVDYVEYCYKNFTPKILNQIEDYLLSTYHDITYKQTVTCQECGFSSEEDAPSSLGFFLGLR